MSRPVRFPGRLVNDRPQFILKADAIQSYAVAFSPDGTLVAAGTLLGRVNVWSARKGTKVASFQAHKDAVRSLVFSADGKSIMSGGDDRDRTVKIWNVTTWKNVRTFRGHQAAVQTLAIGPNGRLVASGSADGTVILRTIATGKVVSVIRPQVKDDFEPDFIECVAFSPDGRVLACAGTESRVTLWRLDTAKLAGTLTTTARSLAFARDGKTLISVGNNQLIRLWTVDSWRHVRSQIGDFDVLSCVVFSPDGKRFAVAGVKRVVLWDTNTFKPVAVFPWPEMGPVFSIEFSPDGKSLAAAGNGEGVRVWRANAEKK